MNKERISVVSKDAAWALANRLFPTDYDKVEELEKQVEALTKKCEERYTELAEAHREKRAALDAIDELNAEIVNLKAKLYDLIVGGKN